MQSHHKNSFFYKINFCDDFYSNIIKIQNMIFLYIYTCESLINIIKEKIIKKLSFTKKSRKVCKERLILHRTNYLTPLVIKRRTTPRGRTEAHIEITVSRVVGTNQLKKAYRLIKFIIYNDPILVSPDAYVWLLL